MAVYNPFSNSSEYYNPYERSSGQESPGVMNTVFNLAKNMAIFGALNIAGAAVLRGVSKKSAGLIKRQVIRSKSKSQLASAIKKMKSPTLGGIFKATDTGQVFDKAYKNSFKGLRRSLAARDRVVKSAMTRSPAEGAVVRATSAFKDMSTFAGTTARLWKRTAWAGAGVAYGIDSLFGVTKDMGIENKPFYDIPGHIVNFGKWMAYDSLYSMPFGAAGPILNAAKGAVAGQVGKVFKGEMGRKVMRGLQRVAPGMPTGPKVNAFLKEDVQSPQNHHSRHFLARTIKAGIAFAKTVPESLRLLNDEYRQMGQTLKQNAGQRVPAIRRMKRAVIDPVVSAVRRSKEVWEKRKAEGISWSSHTTPGLRAVEFAHQVAQRAKGGEVQKRARRNRGKPKGSLQNLLNTMGPEFKRLSKGKSWLDSVPELRGVKNRDVVDENFWKRTYNDLIKAYPEKQARQFINHIKNMRVGPTVYTGHGAHIRGGGVDLSIFDPVKSIRRTAAAALSKPFHIPFTGINLDIGSLIGAHTWLSQEPSFEFFSTEPQYKIGKRANIKGAVYSDTAKTIGELASPGSLYAYSNGKFGIIDGHESIGIDWNRRLRYSAAHGAYKKNEQQELNQQWYIEEAARANKQRNARAQDNKFLKFANYLEDKFNLTVPGFARRFLGNLTAKMDKGKLPYSLAVAGIPGGDYERWWMYAPVFGTLKQHTAQEVIQVFRKKEALALLADASGARHNAGGRFDNLWDIMLSNKSLMDRLDDLEINKPDDFNRLMDKQGVREAVEMARAFPQMAEKNIVTKRLGPLSDMNSYDKIRVALVEDSLGTQWMDAAGGNFNDHPLVKAIPELRKRGLINDRHAKALELHAIYTAFEDEGLYAYTGKPLHQTWRTTVDNVRRRLHGIEQATMEKMMDHINNTDLRSANIRSSQDVLNPRNNKYYKDRHPYVSIGEDLPTGLIEYGRATVDTVSNLISEIYPFKKNPVDHFGIRGNLRYVLGSAAKVAGAWYAFKAADAFVAANPAFDDTALEDGIGPMVADTLAKGRLTTGRIFDYLGVTGVAKHLNGLMPGFTTSAPGAMVGAVVSRTIGGGPLNMAKWFAGGAFANRILSPLLPDFTKSYEDLKAEYSGEVQVPMMKSPFWLLGGTPWEGQKVQGFQPNWYVRAKTRWQETDTLYGSTFRRLLHEPIFPLGFSIGDFVDPYYMERKHYFSRPYPETGSFGEEIPLFGPIISATVGRIIKPNKTMHQEFLAGTPKETDPYPFAVRPPTLSEGWFSMQHTPGIRTMGGRSANQGNFIYNESRTWGHAVGEDFLYNVQNFTGLQGFLAGTITDRLVNKPRVMPTLETAGRIASQSRSFYDMNLGGAGVFTEPIRRLLVKPEYKRHGINPIPNMMPNWLPKEFLHGDPYEKIMRGELRLPGEAYNRTHPDTEFSMPGRASMIGGPTEHMVQYFTGLLPPVLKEEYDILETGTEMHSLVQQHLAAEGLLIQAEKFVYDVRRDISGHIDAIIKDGQGGRGKRALEIKTISSDALAKMDGPQYQHVGQLNFYLNQLGLKHGSILYVARDNPSNVRTFEVNYSHSRFERDMQKLTRARQVAADMLAKDHIGDRYGYSMSWLDRLNVLSDVAPTSQEFKEAKYVVEQQMKFGELTEKEITKYKRALKNRQTRLRKYELYPFRFKGKVFSPDTERNIQSINEDILAAEEYSLPERVVGAAWENFTNINFWPINKFFAFKDPLEHYKMTRLYGKEYKPWDEPYRGFIEPYSRGLASKTDPFSGALSWATGGYLMAGPVGLAAGSVLGSAYGAVHGLFRKATDSTYIPGIVQERRQIESYFDTLKYERNSRMSQLSEGLVRDQYLEAKDATLKAFNSSDGNVANLFRATPFMEKPYIEAWLNVNDPKERQEILQYLPKDLGGALERQWGKDDARLQGKSFVENTSDFMASGGDYPAFSRELMDPSVMLQDIKLKTVEEAGFDAHEFGLGWNEQMLRLQQNYNRIASVDSARYNSQPEYIVPDISPAHVRQSIIGIFARYGIDARAQVYINTGANDSNVLNITVRRDRSQSIMMSLRNYDRYGS